MKTKILAAIFCLALPLPAFAGWVGPKVVVSGTWGKGERQFGFRPGETWDYFPKDFCVLNDGKVVIEDSVNSIWNIYKSNGIFEKTIDVDATNLHCFGNDNIATFHNENGFGIGVVNVKSGNWEWMDTPVQYISGDSIDIEIGSGFIFEIYKGKYYKYSPNGQLLQIYTTHPLELGVVRGDKCKIKVAACKTEACTRKGWNHPEQDCISYFEVEYPDAVYIFEESISDHKSNFSGQVRVNNYLIIDNVFSGFAGGQRAYAYSVTRTILAVGDRKEKRLLGWKATWLQPQDRYKEIPRGQGVEPKVINYAEYGDPVIGPDGSIYCWMRSETHYKILKWSWKD